MIAPTENLLEYKIVERNMAHLFYLGKYYLALLVWPKAPATRVHTTIGGSRFGLGLARTA